jgi:fatty-acyl-CoA synthase
MSARVSNRRTATIESSNPAAKAWLRALAATSTIGIHPDRTLPVLIAELAERHGRAPALLSRREGFSYAELAARANLYACWALAQGLVKGDTVCLLMPNRPEYLAIWLGLTRVGVVVSLLNTSLTGASLAHCIAVAAPRHIIVAAELIIAFESARTELADSPQIWVHGCDHAGLPRIDHALNSLSSEPLPAHKLPPVGIEDRALYIYTSGTTGLPKAAIVSHHRVMRWSLWFGALMDVRASDRMYDCLPMYHSVGGIVAIGALLAHGRSVVIREKFSAREFWDDVTRYDCTLLQYIGELCRYLLRAEPHPREWEHRIRIACGNGLRPDVWNAFKERFCIPQILEFYAATEGNFSLYNVEGEPGAIGRVPPFLSHRLPTALIQLDIDAGKPIRDANGFCVRVAIGEVGEAIGRISAGAGQFEGYTNMAESERKILRDVFEPGDAWFRTGDLMRRDARGFFYFVDRIGDTFRWKGENVSTCEVAEAMSEYPGILEANVYGVEVPSTDGRAGMAAIVVNQGFDLGGLRSHLAARLPDYARPLFVRVCSGMELTGTFKHKKSDLVRAGFDPRRTGDPIYFNDPERGAFVALDEALYERLERGAVRV